MEISQGRLEEFNANFADQHGISEEEAEWMIDHAVIGITAMMECLKPIVDAAMQMWKTIKDVALEVYEHYEKLSQKQKVTWPIVWDTRKRSQVMSNKPKFMVRKIIS